jgi:hypothetical protein
MTFRSVVFSVAALGKRAAETVSKALDTLGVAGQETCPAASDSFGIALAANHAARAVGVLAGSRSPTGRPLPVPPEPVPVGLHRFAKHCRPTGA